MLACLALAPNLMVQVFFGHVGKRVARLAGADLRTTPLHDLTIVAGLAVCIAVMALVASMARKAVSQAAGERGLGAAGSREST